MPFADKAIQAVRQLIGDPVLLHLDQVFLKPGKQGMGTNWHQDNAYFEIDDPLKGTAMWTAVHDATIANGTIHVIPGSYRVAYEHSRDPYSNHHIRCYRPRTRRWPSSCRPAASPSSLTASPIVRWPTIPAASAPASPCTHQWRNGRHRQERIPAGQTALSQWRAGQRRAE